MELTRAATLRLILIGFQIPFRWWILAAEAVRCFENKYAVQIYKPVIPMPVSTEGRLYELYFKSIVEGKYIREEKEAVSLVKSLKQNNSKRR